MVLQTAFAGDQSIEVDGDLLSDGWRVGDAIVIAYMSHRAEDADRRVITSLSPSSDSTVIGLSQPLVSTRLGRPDRRLQSEVLNLSRGVTITGDPISNGIGLHTIGFHAKHHMIHYTRVENCGQLGITGKYCLHFHHAMDCPMCSFVGNAIERGEQRGIIIHGTHNSLTERNVLFDLKGSYIYIEDGNEMQNTIRQNVALCPRKDSCRQGGTDNGLADDNHQSGIWALSVSNDFIENRNIGHREGFFTQTTAFGRGRGKAANRVCTMNAPLGIFRGNVQHSNARFGWYLDSNWPRKINRSVESNGYLPKDEFGNTDFSSCEALTPDGRDNGASSAIEDNLDIANVFSGQYAAGDVQYLRWHNIAGMLGMYWKQVRSDGGRLCVCRRQIDWREVMAEEGDDRTLTRHIPIFVCVYVCSCLPTDEAVRGH